MNLLITGAFKCTELEIQEIEKLGYNCIYMQDEKAEINVKEDWVEGIICNGFFLYHNIEEFKNLKLIQLTSAGLDRLPMDYIQNTNIQVFNARGVYSVPIAEMVILKILEIYKSSRSFWEQQKNHIWEKNRNLLELNGKTACIIGYGSIGQEIAKRLSSFNVNIIAIDKVKHGNVEANEFYSLHEIDKVLKKSDIVVLTLPLTQQTKGIINDKTLKNMKKNSILVNVSRGELIVEENLIEQIEKNKFLGVVLDVFENEPLDKKNKLWDFPNVLITPHNSFISENNAARMFNVILNNLKGRIL